ncbi:hypothetical protein CBS147332_6782 [Penicillium roqueforti]|nr:hypothetical protein CBS147332_6782 [Penicillium roqueforti]KAI3112136.1 hypothetical protein CBS147331_4690 [Penicillium roqueforti]
MQGQGSDVHGHQGHLPEENVKIPSNNVHINQDAFTPDSPNQTIHQENRALSLLLSPPPSSPLIPLGTIDSAPTQYSPEYPAGPQFTRMNGSYRVYNPIRGAELRTAADLANPFRDRLDQGGQMRDHGRARSRSPYSSIQSNGLLESQDLPAGPARGFNHYPREVYVPPGINDLMHLNLPSSSPTLFPDNTHSGGRDLALSLPGDSLGQNYHLNDGNWYGYPQEQQQQQVQGPERPPVAKQEEEDLDDNYEDHLCEFAAPCRMHPSPDGMHYRKVVSHVFGRNKAVTKLFPLGVWVHYCRKHYQRARYRADQWPFTQCDLLLESLTRMESWDGVESFELILRRREQMRVGREAEGTTTTETSKQKEVAPSGKAQDQGTKSSAIVTRPGRRHPTAIIAPVPDWLRQHVGHGKTFQEIRQIIEMVRSHMVRLRNQERAQQQLNDVPKSPGKPGSLRRGSSSSIRKGRTAKGQAPLPLRPSTVRFPDVEILPHFKPWVKEAALRQRSATNGPMNMNMNEPEIKDESEQRILGGGRVLGEIQDNRDTNGAGSSQASNGDFAATAAQHCEGRLESVTAVSADDTAGVNLLQVQPHIGRAGTNRGQSESQRRRSERVYIKALDRLPGQSLNKKTIKEDEEEEAENDM